MAAGDFSTSALLDAQLKVEQIWADNMEKQDYVAHVDAFNAIKAAQTAKLDILTDPEKDRDVKVHWIKDCDATAPADLTDQCTVGGVEAETAATTYGITVRKTIGWSVKENPMRSSIFSVDEVNAKLMLSHMKQMDEFVTQTLVSTLDTFAGTNAVTTPYAMVGTDTSIPAYAWTPNLFAYFSRVSILNKMDSSIMLSGSNLYDQYFNVTKEIGNAQDGQANKSKMDVFPIYFDLWNVDGPLAAAKTFLIKKGAVAFVSRARNPITPEGNTAILVKSKMGSRNLAGVEYDLRYKVACGTNEITHHYSLDAEFDLFLNPLGCTATRKGVLSFVCE